jgi:hypothetical protein
VCVCPLPSRTSATASLVGKLLPRNQRLRALGRRPAAQMAFCESAANSENSSRGRCADSLFTRYAHWLQSLPSSRILVHWTSLVPGQARRGLALLAPTPAYFLNSLFCLVSPAMLPCETLPPHETYCSRLADARVAQRGFAAAAAAAAAATERGIAPTDIRRLVLPAHRRRRQSRRARLLGALVADHGCDGAEALMRRTARGVLRHDVGDYLAVIQACAVSRFKRSVDELTLLCVCFVCSGCVEVRLVAES